jgi:hypothetical protein
MRFHLITVKTTIISSAATPEHYSQTNVCLRQSTGLKAIKQDIGQEGKTWWACR